MAAPDATKTGGLNDLFASLRSPSSSNPQLQSSSSGTQPNRSTWNGMMSQDEPPAPGAHTASTAQSNLLDLLKFGSTTPAQPAAQPQSPVGEVKRPQHGPASTHSVHGRGISASDLVATLRASSSKPATPPQPMPRSSSATHQESLLKLLNQTASSADEQSSMMTPTKNPNATAGPFSTRDSSPPVRVFGSGENTPTSFQPAISAPPPSSAKGGIFTYINPFEQLSSSSPLKAQSRSPAVAIPAKLRAHSPVGSSSHIASASKLTQPGAELIQSVESNNDAVDPTSISEEKAIENLGAPSRDTETVAKALNEVGEQAHKQMESALAEAEHSRINTVIRPKPTPMAPPEKDHLPKETGAAKNKPTPVPKPETMARMSPTIPTYQFPMRPFVSLDVHMKASALHVREDAVVHIARFKKEFDQIDRTLSAASKDFIVYASPKNGGVRLIRQDNGDSSLLFPNTQDRIFNVAITIPQDGSGFQRVIATGVSGTVYSTTVGSSDHEYSEANMQGQSMSIPPPAGTGDSVSTGQLKTRAKKSSRHSDYFAVGRGKAINIIFPVHARSSTFFGKNGALDTEKYFADRPLKVTTGKAGKDFAFSEDDTAIVSLDKAGRLKLWDIRDLTADNNAVASKIASVEVKTPLLQFATSAASEKSWPTSVLFVDKVRAYAKGIAQRYIIVGMKQNHTLQLWDLCLGKAVQELNFPHENETDAICSIAYHPNTGIIAVGHPTRNSIFLIHLSAPRYNLSSMSQAKFLQRLANRDTTLPKAEATAIMSGLREYSLSDIGQLRSLELIPSPSEDGKDIPEDEDPALFELYLLHSKGVTCLSFNNEDLGWNLEHKPQLPIDAEEQGLISVKDLREIPLPQSDVASVNGDVLPVPVTKPAPSPARSAAKPADKVQKSEKKKAKTASSGEETPKVKLEDTQPVDLLEDLDPAPKPAPVDHSSKPNGHTNDLSRDISNSTAKSDSINLGVSPKFLADLVKQIEHGVNTSSQKSFHAELDALHRRLDSDKQVHNTAMAANQEAILRLVSKQLGENVEKSLTAIVNRSIKDFVVPLIPNVVGTHLEKALPVLVAKQIREHLPAGLKSTVPDAVNHAVHNNGTLARAISKEVTPSMNDISKGITTAAHGTSQALRDDVRRLDQQHRDDSAKIDHLTNSVRVLSETIHRMAEAQSDFQSEVLRLQQQQRMPQGASAASPGATGAAALGDPRASSPTPSDSVSVRVTMTPEQQEVENIQHELGSGRFEEATITWLQSPPALQTTIFERVFAAIDPAYLHQISPLVVLSVGAAISGTLDRNLPERLNWLNIVLSSFNPNHPDLAKVARKVLDVIAQRLQAAYMRIAESQPGDESLRRIAVLSRRVGELMALAPAS